MAKRKLSYFSTADLQKELTMRRAALQNLVARRNALANELTQLEDEINSLGGPVTAAVRVASASSAARVAVKKRGPGRPAGGQGKSRTKNALTLPQALAKVLKGKTMGVAEVAGAVQKAGYKTDAANFRTMVNQALIKHTNLFKKVDRGQYTAS